MRVVVVAGHGESDPRVGGTVGRGSRNDDVSVAAGQILGQIPGEMRLKVV